MSEWLFADPPNAAAITTHQVLSGAAILYVSHNLDDGAWQFHTGETVNYSDAKVVALKEIIQMDSSIVILADLPLGWVATRSDVTATWQRFEIDR